MYCVYSEDKNDRRNSEGTYAPTKGEEREERGEQQQQQQQQQHHLAHAAP